MRHGLIFPFRTPITVERLILPRNAISNMKRILVTGASGFVGRHCLPKLLDRDFEVHAVTRQSLLHIPAVHWHFADLEQTGTTAELLRDVQPTHLLHLAWYAEPGAFASSPINCEWMDRSTFLFREFERLGGERIVATGSCFEYDCSDGVCDEFRTPCRSRTNYGRAKLATAAYLDALGSTMNMSTAWARLFFLYGPHASDRRMPGVVISSLMRNEPALCSEGTQLRDFLHIEDAASAIVSLVDSDVTGPVNVCSGSPVRIRDMATTVAEMLGRPDLLCLGKIPTVSDEPILIAGSTARLRNELHWKPQYSLEEGLRKTIEFHRLQQVARAA